MDEPRQTHSETGVSLNEFFSWKEEAICFKLVQLLPPLIDAWFQDEDTEESKLAAETCFECPVRRECLQQACDSKEPYGIWGGLPASVRNRKGRTHNYARLVGLPNPYDNKDGTPPSFPTIKTKGKGDPDEQ